MLQFGKKACGPANRIGLAGDRDPTFTGNNGNAERSPDQLQIGDFPSGACFVEGQTVFKIKTLFRHDTSELGDGKLHPGIDTVRIAFELNFIGLDDRHIFPAVTVEFLSDLGNGIALLDNVFFCCFNGGSNRSFSLVISLGFSFFGSRGFGSFFFVIAGDADGVRSWCVRAIR